MTRFTLLFYYFLILLSVCSSKEVLADLAQSEHPLIKQVKDSYHPGVRLIQSIPIERGSSSQCHLSEVTLQGVDPVTLKPQRVQLALYESKKKASASVLIAAPILGIGFIDRFYAKSFCQRGLNAAILTHWDYYSEPGIQWEIHDRDLLRGISAIRSAVEYLSHLAPGAVGILGTSQGAILAAHTLPVEDRLTSGVLIVGGAPLSKIAAESQLKEAIELREARMKHYNIRSEASYQRLVQKHIKINGLELAQNSSKKNLFMILGSRDTTVPTSSQIDLWHAFGEPESLQLPWDHAGTIGVTYFFYTSRIIQFLTNHLRGVN